MSVSTVDEAEIEEYTDDSESTEGDTNSNSCFRTCT